jgi:hypothetical protein
MERKSPPLVPLAASVAIYNRQHRNQGIIDLGTKRIESITEGCCAGVVLEHQGAGVQTCEERHQLPPGFRLYSQVKKSLMVSPPLAWKGRSG